MLQNLADGILAVADWITLHITVWMLIGVGLFLAIVTRGVQFRMFRQMWRVVLGSREGAHGGISSFQAFTISLAARVGIGNVFGVAVALLMGGPGAIFWMWIVALIGMATAFFEATLAQLFKVKAADGTFRGGPAYYMSRGVGSKVFGMIFAIITVVTCGFVITSVQANAIAATMMGYFGISPWVAAAILFVMAAPVILGGIRSVARVTEIVAPVMAVLYVLVAVVIVILNITAIPGLIALIVRDAFTGAALGGGVGGGILAAIINGAKRGLFSNEAGQGTAPNAAATATVAHPVSQGLIQSLGVFIDTILVCSATAFIILLAGPEVWSDPSANPATLTTMAVSHAVGSWAEIPMVILIFVLAFSSVIAAYVYSDVNMSFVTQAKAASWAVRVVSVGSVVLGAVVSIDVVWNSVDIAMAIMTVTNLVALALLWKWGVGALKDYESQLAAGRIPVFNSRDNKFLPGILPGDVWDRRKETESETAKVNS